MSFCETSAFCLFWNGCQGPCSGCHLAGVHASLLLLHIPELCSAPSVCLTVANPCASSASTLYRARAIHSLIPLLCSLNISSTSDCDSLPPSLECGSRCNARALNEPFVRGGSCVVPIRGMTLACGRVKSLGVSNRTHWCVSTSSFLHLILPG